MNKRDKKWLDMAVKLAISGEKVGGARIGSVLVINNRPIAFGQNMNKTHPMQKRFGKNPEAIYMHSEINCLTNFLRFNSPDDLRAATLYVGRVSGHANDLRIGLAKPCAGCQKAIKKYGIKRVIYTENGV